MTSSPVFFFVVVVVVIIIVVIVIVLIFVVVEVLFLVIIVVVFGVVGPAFRLLGEFEVEFVPGVEVQLFDLAVEILDFHELVVFVHGQDAEGLVLFLVLVPLARDRCVFSAHGTQASGGGARV